MSDQPPSGPPPSSDPPNPPPGGYPRPEDQPTSGGYQQPGGYQQFGGYPPQGNYPPPGNYPPQGGNPPPGNYPPQGNYPPGGYEQPGQYPSAAPKNTLGTVALILGVLAILACWTIIGGYVLGLLAVVLGFVARSRYKNGAATNGTASTVSIILGFVAIALSTALIVLGIGFFNSIGGRDYLDCINDAGNSQAARDQCNDEFQRNVENRYDVTIEPPR